MFDLRTLNEFKNGVSLFCCFSQKFPWGSPYSHPLPFYRIVWMTFIGKRMKNDCVVSCQTYTGASISPNFKAIFVIILGINWSHHRVRWPKLHQILKTKSYSWSYFLSVKLNNEWRSIWVFNVDFINSLSFATWPSMSYSHSSKSAQN